jgi:acyl carrier protein
MHRVEIQNNIHTFVVTNFLFGQTLDLQAEDSLLDNGVIDSTGVLELVAFLEEHYGIKVEDDEVIPDNLDSTGRIAAYVEMKLSCAA